MKFCNICGDSITIAIPNGDNRERHICSGCGEVHYQNPKIVTGCIPVWQDRILLCRRAIEPRKGLWTVPAGFMENQETLQEGAARETMEEARAPVGDMQLYGIYNLPRISQVYVVFLAQLEREDGFGIGEESLEVDLFAEHEIPWDEMAFRVIETALRRYLEERKHSRFSIDLTDLI
ncbi:MAG: NUDIX hydrolase [bacterium]